MAESSGDFSNVFCSDSAAIIFGFNILWNVSRSWLMVNLWNRLTFERTLSKKLFTPIFIYLIFWSLIEFVSLCPKSKIFSQVSRLLVVLFSLTTQCSSVKVTPKMFDYDVIDWRFLKCVMRQFGFHNVWIQ